MPSRWNDEEISRLRGFLRTVADHRGRQGRSYPLEYLLALPLIAGMAGDGELDAAAEWAAAAPAELLIRLGAPLDREGKPRRPGAGDDGAGGGERQGGPGGSGENKRGPGARAGRRDYSHLPRFTVVWDFEGDGYCCPECGEPFTRLGDHVTELLDWVVIVRLAAHCRRRYRRACGCRVPATVMAPGPPKAIGKGLFSNAFTAMLLTERCAAGRSMDSLVAGLARQGAGISPATLAGTCARASGALLAPAADAIAGRARGSWHLHADETTWRVFAPREGGGPAKWWLWVFLGPDTCCFVIDPGQAGGGAGPPRRDRREDRAAGADEDGGPRRLVISSDFCKVYESAGKKADGLAGLYCQAHIRRHFVRAGDANPAPADLLGAWHGWTGSGTCNRP